MTSPETPAEHGIRECPNCGYCLRGAVSLVCPECGLDVVVARQTLRAKAARRDSIYCAMIFVTFLVSWIHCNLTGGWSIALDDDNVSTARFLVYLVLFNLPLHMLIAGLALFCFFPGLPSLKPLGRIIALVNLIIVLFGIGTTVVLSVV